MGKANFTEDFKRDAVLQITERGYPVEEVAARLGSASTRSTSGRSNRGSEAASELLAGSCQIG